MSLCLPGIADLTVTSNGAYLFDGNLSAAGKNSSRMSMYVNSGNSPYNGCLSSNDSPVNGADC